MSAIDFWFIGWCRDVAAGSDKIWVAFCVNETYFAGWGRRGKSLTFKKHGFGWSARHSLTSMVGKKKDGGYVEVNEAKMNSVFPHFRDEVQSRLVTAILSDTVK